MKKIFILFVLSCLSCDAVFIENISDKSVILLAPADGTEIDGGNIKFSWQSIEGATNYELQIATPSFKSAIRIVLDTTVTTTSFNDSISIGDYQWRVKAQNSEYETNFTTSSFKIN